MPHDVSNNKYCEMSLSVHVLILMPFETETTSLEIMERVTKATFNELIGADRSPNYNLIINKSKLMLDYYLR